MLFVVRGIFVSVYILCVCVVSHFRRIEIIPALKHEYQFYLFCCDYRCCYYCLLPFLPLLPLLPFVAAVDSYYCFYPHSSYATVCCDLAANHTKCALILWYQLFLLNHIRMFFYIVSVTSLYIDNNLHIEAIVWGRERHTHTQLSELYEKKNHIHLTFCDALQSYRGYVIKFLRPRNKYGNFFFLLIFLEMDHFSISIYISSIFGCPLIFAQQAFQRFSLCVSSFVCTFFYKNVYIYHIYIRMVQWESGWMSVYIEELSLAQWSIKI